MRALLAFALILSLVGADAQAATMPPLAQKKRTKRYVPKKKKKVVKKSVVKSGYKIVDPVNRPVVGTWYLLDSQQQFVKMTKIVFTKYGEFTFTGSAWKSSGTFRYREAAVVLTWTNVDGEPVKPGSMKKSLPVFDGGKLIQLDRFQYGKAF